jgi:hypothetical protein
MTINRVTESEIDTNEEKAKALNIIIDNLNQVEAKVEQLATVNDAYNAEVDRYNAELLKKPKPKKKAKKGVVTVKTLVITVMLAVVLLFASNAQGAAWQINYDNCSNPENLVRLLRDRFSNQTADTYTFTPSTEPSSTDATEGMVYYDSTADALKLRNASAWVDIDVAGASSLDTAYDTGIAITVDAGAVALTATNAADNTVFQVVQSDTGTALGIDINNAGTGNSIDIQGTGGNDIEGTDDTWAVSTAGVGTFVSFALENGETIKNDSNNEIEFAVPSGEDISFNLATNNTCTLTTDSGLDSFAFGVVDDLEGVGSIVFDDAASTITLTSTGATDLTISQATSGQDASLILQSSGTGTDALSLISSVADISLSSADNITRTAADNITDTTTDGSYTISIGGSSNGDWTVGIADKTAITSVDNIDFATSAASADIDIDAAAGSVIIDGGEAVADAVTITATTALGGIDITSNADIDITTTGASDEDISLINTGGSVELSASEDATDAINIDATAGGIDIDAAGEAGQDIVITNTGGSVLIQSTESAVDSIKLQSTLGGIDILCDASTNEDIDIANTGGAVNLTSSEASDGAIKLQTSNAAGQILLVTADTSSDAVEMDISGGLEIDAVDTIAIDNSGSTKDITITSALGRVIVTGTESAGAAVSLIADGTAGGVNIDAKTGGVDIDAVGGTINLDTSGAGIDIDLDATAGAVSIDGGQTGADAVVIIASHTDGGIDMDFGTGGLSVVGASGDIVATVAGDTSDVITVTNTTGTGDAAISFVGTAGGINADAAKSIYLTSTENSADSITIQSTLGGIDIRCDASDDEAIDISNATGPINITSTHDQDPSINIATSDAAGQVQITSTDTTVDGLEIDSSGGIDIDAADDIDIQVTSGATGEDLRLMQTGAQDAHVLISATGTSIDAIKLHSDGGTGAGILIHNDAGTTFTDGAASIQLLSDVGGIDLTATGGTDTGAINLAAPAGGITMACVKDFALTVTSAATGDDMTFTQTGTTPDAHIAFALNGTSADAFSIQASAGGIDIDTVTDGIHIKATGDGANDDITLQVDGDDDSHIILDSDGTSIDTIYLHQSAGTGGGIKLHADAGTATTSGAASITLISDVGGIDIQTTGVASANAIRINAGSGGGIDMDATEDINILLTAGTANEDILIATGGDQDSHVTITADGSSANAFTVLADAGGIDIDAATDTIHIKNAADGDQDDITIQMSGAHDASIILDNTQGTGTDAISLQATAGSVDIDAVATGDITLNGGQILVTSEHNTASAISLVTNTGASETIVITNTLGTGSDAINIDTSAAGGGIDVDTANGPIALTAGNASNGDITLTAGDVISLVAADVAGIVATTATYEHKAKYFPISPGVVSASEIFVGGGTGVTCVGLGAGAAEVGSTEGYVQSDTDTDYIRYWVSLPGDFVDAGAVTDLVLSWDIDEQAAAAGTIDVLIYEYDGNANTTAIVTDTIEFANDGTRQMLTLNTLSTGIGAAAELGNGDALLIVLSQDHTDDDFNLYGMKMVYRVGLQATE